MIYWVRKLGSCGNLKLWSCGVVALLSSGVVELWSCETVELWNCGVVGPWNCGAVELWSCGIMKPWSCEAVELWNCGVVKLWIRGVVELWNWGAVELWNCGVMELWSCGAVKLWSCGVVKLWSSGAVEVQKQQHNNRLVNQHYWCKYYSCNPVNEKKPTIRVLTNFNTGRTCINIEEKHHVMLANEHLFYSPWSLYKKISFDMSDPMIDASFWFKIITDMASGHQLPPATEYRFFSRANKYIPVVSRHKIPRNYPRFLLINLCLCIWEVILDH